MKSLSPEGLKAELDRGHFCPVYLILGPEEYTRRSTLRTIRASVLAGDAADFNFAEFAAGASMREVLEVAETFPMMAPRRLVTAEIEKIPAPQQELLTAYVRRPSPKTVLVLLARELDRRTGFYRFLAEKTCIVEAPRLKGYAMVRWAEDYVRRRGLRASSASITKIVDLAGSDLMSLVNEIEKLALYGGGNTIPDAAVDELVQKTRQHGIFELTGAIGMRDRRKALMLLGNLIEGGEPPLLILAMMARHFRQTIIALEMMRRGRRRQEIGRAAQVPAFALKAFLEQARATGLDTARRMYVSLAGIDTRFKSSTVDERMILEDFVCSL